MKKNVLALFLALLPYLFLQAQFDCADIDYDRPQEFEIGGVTVTGTKSYEPRSLINLSGLRVGKEITIPGADISSAIRRLWKQGILGDVEINCTKIEGNKIFLNIAVKERPVVSRVIVTGVSRAQGNNVKEKLPVIAGKVVTDALLKNIRLKVQDYFIEKGFLSAKANIATFTDTLLNNHVILNIKVKKGRRVKIKEIIVKGNTAVKKKKILKKLKKTKEASPFHLFTPSKFTKERYEEDKENLISFYNTKGYRDARIVSDSMYFVSKDRVNISVNLEEGNQYKYRNITWKGNYIYDDDFLAKILKIKKGDIYNPEQLSEKLNFSMKELDITSLYMDNGYLFFRINPVEKAIIGDSIDIEIQIYEGEQADINKVVINGNTKTHDKVIRREIRVRPGQKFSRALLIRSQREIAQQGYFNPETIGMNPIPNPVDGTVDINFDLEEKPSDQIQLSGGWGGAFGFVGTLGVVFNNFSARKIFKFRQWGGVLPSGDGQRLSVQFQANGRAFQTYSATFTEPWLGGRKPQSFTVNLSHSVQRRVFGTQTLGALRVSGITLSLGRRMTWPDDWFVISNSLSYLRYNNDNFSFILPFGVSQNFSFNTTISRNSVDNPTYPRKGANVSLNVNLTPPYSLLGLNDFENKDQTERFRLVEYHKWMFDNSWFTSIVGNLVLNTRAHFGFIGTYNTDLGIGPFDRFSLGGDGLTGQNFLLGTEIIGLRGYANNSLPTPIQNDPDGVVFNKYVMELRYPISLNPAATVFVLSFMEAGNSWADYAEFSPFDLKRSVGVGARIFMPAFGMIGLDWAYGFDDIVGGGQDVSGSRFHFRIGQQIR